MLRDLEGRKINVCQIPNAHILILGKSGEGKTYFCCRRMEEEVQDGKSVIIFDYSSSYSIPELIKCKFRYVKCVRILNPFGEEVDFMFGLNGLESANVKHFFTLLGKMFFTSYGKEFFIYHGKQIFTSQGKHLFTRYGKQTLSSAQPCG